MPPRAALRLRHILLVNTFSAFTQTLRHGLVAISWYVKTHGTFCSNLIWCTTFYNYDKYQPITIGAQQRVCLLPVAVESPHEHSGRRAGQRLSGDRRQGQTVGTAATCQTTSRPGGTDQQGTELPAGESVMRYRWYAFVMKLKFWIDITLASFVSIIIHKFGNIAFKSVVWY